MADEDRRLRAARRESARREAAQRRPYQSVTTQVDPFALVGADADVDDDWPAVTE